MIKLIFLFYLLFFSQYIFAGGDGAWAKITKYQELPNEKYIVEFEWLERKGFIAQNTQTKLLFDLYNWPSEPLSFITKFASLFYNPWDRKYPSQKFRDSLVFIKVKYENHEKLQLGQMGTAEFQVNKDNSEQIIVPFAEISKTFDGTEAVFLYAAPN